MKKPAKKISAKEAKFRAMTKAQKRVTIAKDVIAALATKKIKAEAGTYLEIGHAQRNEWSLAHDARHLGADEFRRTWQMPMPNIDDELRDVLASQRCTVCAVGAMFTCMLQRHDRLTVVAASEMPGLHAYLHKFFSPVQLSLIESAFERSHYGVANYTLPAIDFGTVYSSDAARLVAIMNNIIENEGTFVP